LGITRTFTQIQNSVNQEAYDFSSQIFRGVRDVVCSYYFSFPDKIAPRAGVIGSINQAFMNQMCQYRELPPRPQPPIIGGQCCDIEYDVNVSYIMRRCNQNALIIQGSGTVRGTGTVRGLVLQTCITNSGLSCLDVMFDSCTGQRTYQTVWSSTRKISKVDCQLVGTTDPKADFINDITSKYSISSIAAVGGIPDTCGNGGGYPPTPPITPPDLQRDIDIKLPDGTEFKIPVTLKLDYNDIDFSLEVPITLDVGGINVTVDLGGITINNSPENPNTSPDGGDRLPTGEKHPLPLPRGPVPCCVPKKPPGSEGFEEDIKDEMDPKKEEDIQDLQYVSVELTLIPSNAKSQAGNGAPRVIYAGWFEFLTEGYAYPRQPIHFTDNMFIPPVGATGYAYTLYTGFQGKARVYTIKR
jgi:hypothetical protein